MKGILLASISIIALSLAAQKALAQNASRSGDTEAVTIDQAGSLYNTADATQNGENNNLIIAQTGGYGTTTVNQSGNSSIVNARNTVIIDQDGDENAMVSQTGDHNFVSISQLGGGQIASVIQTGYNHVAHITQR